MSAHQQAAAMSAPLVEIAGVHKSFGGVRAVEDVSLQLHPGEVVAVVFDVLYRRYTGERLA